MKKILFGLIATTLFSISGFANNVKIENKQTVNVAQNNPTGKQNVSVVLKTNNNKEIKLNFKSFEEFENANLSEYVKEFTNDKNATCTATVTVTASVGFLSVSVSFAVEVDCKDLVNATIGLYKQAKQAIAAMN
jgi:hypothetical protein